MIENMETLLVLSRTGTMMEASTELRVSQSAVSKRIAALEKYYDKNTKFNRSYDFDIG